MKLHILYTEEEGGDFHYIAKHSDEETRQFFQDTVKSGYLIHSIGDRTIKVAPAYICLAEIAEDFDFVLKKSRLHPQDTPEGAGSTLEYKDPMAEVAKDLENAIEKPEGEGANDQ